VPGKSGMLQSSAPFAAPISPRTPAPEVLRFDATLHAPAPPSQEKPETQKL
jgi:hypothetical protein